MFRRQRFQKQSLGFLHFALEAFRINKSVRVICLTRLPFLIPVVLFWANAPIKKLKVINIRLIVLVMAIVFSPV